jgi:hypothetical protein
MKKILLFLSVLIITYSFSGCKKDLTQVMIKSTIKANQLSSLSAGSFVLQMSDATNTFQTFNWTEVDYGFPTAISYTLQLDKRTGTFATPIDIVTVPNLLEATVTVGDFNKALLNLGMSTDAADSIKIRVKTVINPNIDPVYSNVVRVKIFPYAVVFPPIYATGAATGGWSWNLYTYKELRSSAPNIYSTVIYFTNNQTFRFFKQTDWNPVSYNFPYFTGTVSNLFVNANDGDQNFLFTGTSGYYQVTVNMTTKSVSMTSVPEPKLFMTGQATGGWDWTTHFVKLTWLSNGIYRATATFTNSGASSTFRFFAQQDWGPTGYNYPYFSAGTISNLFVNANDGDKNFQFTGTTGSYVITVNMLDLIISMVPAP